MMSVWLRGLLRRRLGRVIAISAGVAVAVALIASLGSFLAASQATMTSRAVREVAVDWQVQLSPQLSKQRAVAVLSADPATTAALPVEFFHVPGLEATTGSSHQTTGAAVILGLPAGYNSTFPGEIRTLAGRSDGVVVAQQTAANLHVGVGDRVRIRLPSHSKVEVKVTGIIDFPQANSLFQNVGAPPQAQPAAPPDNVIAMPSTKAAQLLGLRGIPGANLTRQIHVARDHVLPNSPAAAFATESASARNAELSLAGAARVGDNLGAALDAARGDALYAEMLFLFLATPGVILAYLVVASVASSGAIRRRNEQALLRTRGASPRTIWRLSWVEVGLTGVIGVLAGCATAFVIGRVAFNTGSFGASYSAALAWFALAAVSGFVMSATTILWPVRGDLRRSKLSDSQGVDRTLKAPWFARWGVDILLLVGAALVTWAASRNNYTLVLAPEGVPSISVSYWALAAPVLFWLGGGLLIWRLVDLVLRRATGSLTWFMRPVAGRLSRTIVMSASRQRSLINRSAVLLALSVSFAVSTSVFNSTFQAQAEVDARLTNGADIAVIESPGANVTPSASKTLAQVPGVSSVEPLQHRYAYVGSDLQDLYGVRPQTVAQATSLQDAYFEGGTAQGLMQKLANDPKAVLVSQETVTDFQLAPGDHLTLRLLDAVTHHYVKVAFTYAGVVKEFPSAPSDSFLVANSAYITQQTHSDAIGTFLIGVAGSDTAKVASAVQTVVGPSVRVTDIGQARGQVGTSLTSVDLRGLTRLELAAAALLAAAAGGLVLSLRLNERRRSFAIAAAVGARGRALSGFVNVEATLVLTTGLVLGAALGAVVADGLIHVLTGVFDPAPDHATVPWGYLAGLFLVVTAAVATATLGAVTWAKHAPVSMLRGD